MWAFIFATLSVQLGILAYNWLYWRRRRLTDCCSAAQVSLSILIPARNERENLPRLLESLTLQRDRAVECWVCD
ncbi:MAG: glycosyltransferase family 2 protein, partial [bacterium]|nr:glycosyltransferase family 2 protein [bacterium]